MDYSKINKTIEKYQAEQDKIAGDLEQARVDLVDDPTDGQLKVIRGLEVELADKQALLQASKQQLKKQQQAEVEAKEKALVDECLRLRSDTDKLLPVALKAVKDVIKMTETIKENVIKAENLAGMTHNNLRFGEYMEYRMFLDLRKLIADWTSSYQLEATIQDGFSKGLFR